MTDRHLRKLVREFRDGILDGRPAEMMCFAVCAPLQAYLAICGIETRLVYASLAEVNHVWLRLPDGRVLDPTADQFGLEAVYLGELPLAYATRKARLRTALAAAPDRPAGAE